MSPQERAAALTVADLTDDAEDARLLLQMLGLIASPEPRKRRVVCPGGCRHHGGHDIGDCHKELPQAPEAPYYTGSQETREGGLRAGYAVLNWLLANGYATTTRAA